LRDIHEAGPSCDHDVLDIWPGLKLGGANEHWGLVPDAIIFEETPAQAFCMGAKSAHCNHHHPILIYISNSLAGGHTHHCQPQPAKWASMALLPHPK
jgi:hypothetical protein